jgi:hypothetical protein
MKAVFISLLMNLLFASSANAKLRSKNLPIDDSEVAVNGTDPFIIYSTPEDTHLNATVTFADAKMSELPKGIHLVKPGVKEGRDLQSSQTGFCTVDAPGVGQGYIYGGTCALLGGTVWNDEITRVISATDTCIETWDSHEGDGYRRSCSDNWEDLTGPFYKTTSRVCCPYGYSSPTPMSLCFPNGGSCTCGNDESGRTITMETFYGDVTDSQIMGCGGDFSLTALDLNAQYGGDLSQTSLGGSIGFKAADSFLGWEGTLFEKQLHN